MLVRMIVHIQGTRDGADWPRPGGVLDVPDTEAADLIAAGLAAEATEDDVPTAPAADEAPVEADADGVETDEEQAVEAAAVDTETVETAAAPKPAKRR